MFEKMQSFDQGCVLHGGRNGKDVFLVKKILKINWLICDNISKHATQIIDWLMLYIDIFSRFYNM